MQINETNNLNHSTEIPSHVENNSAEDPAPKTSSHNPIWEVIKFFLLAFIVVAPIRIFIAQPFIVSGASMNPTFATGQYLIVDEISYRFSEPQRGDVIVLKYPKNPKKYFIKRIIGLPGEKVTINNGVVSIIEPGNPVPIILDEPYIAFEKKDSLQMSLDDDEYFVMGDNRAASLDSRSWGPLPEKLVVGRAWLRLFPVSGVSYLPGKYVQPSNS